MLRKLNCFLNIVIGSFIGVFIGFGIYKFWHFKTYSNLYVMQSAPWYTELLLDCAMVAVGVVVCIVLKLVIWRKLNCFLNIVIGSFIGVFIGYGIYKFWHFKTYPNLYVMQSTPWYTELLLDGAMVAVGVVVCIVLKLVIWRKLKP